MKNLFLMFILLQSGFILSQDVTVTETPPFQTRTYPLYCIGSDETGYYLQRTDQAQRQSTIQKLGLDFKPLFSIDITDKQKDEIHPRAYLVKNRVLFFTTLWEKDREVLLMREYMSSTGVMQGQVKQVGEIPKEKNTKCYFSVQFSPDDSKMMVVKNKTRLQGTEESAVEVYETATFRKLTESSFPATYNSANVLGLKYFVTNKGRVVGFFGYKKTEKSEHQSFVYTSIAAGEGRPQFSPLDFRDVDLVGANVTEVAGKIVFCGLFTENESAGADKKEKDPKKKTGVFANLFEAESGMLIKTQFSYLDQDVDAQINYSEVKKSHKDYGVKFEGLEVEGSDVYLFASHRIGGMMFMSAEILVAKLSVNGTLDWAKVIPRSTYNEFHPFINTVSKGRVFIVYEEREECLSLPLEKYNPADYRFTTGGKDVVVVTEVNGTGQLSRKQIPSPPSKQKSQFGFSFAIESGKVMLFHGKFFKAEQFLVLDIK